MGQQENMARACRPEGCKIQPVYNKKGEIRPLYCLKHKLTGMINIKMI